MRIWFEPPVGIPLAIVIGVAVMVALRSMA